MPHDLGDGLLKAGLVTQLALDQARARQKVHGGDVGAWLVRLGSIGEVDLLRHLASAHNTRFVTTEKLARLMPSAELLDFVPVAKAESVCACPVHYDVSARALTVVIANPRQAHALDEVPRIAKLERVNAFVALEPSIRKLIRKAYYGDRRAFEGPDESEALTEFRCPQCGSFVNPDQLQCENCELLLNPEATTGDHEISVVRAMIGEVTGSKRRPAAPEREEVTTAAFTALDPSLVPTLIAGVDLASRPLSEFEAYLCSFVDGGSTVQEIAARAKVSEIEAMSVFGSLANRDVIAMAPKKPKAPTPPEPKKVSATPPLTKIPTRKPAAPLDAPGAPEGRTDNLLQRAVALEKKGDIDQAIGLLKYGIARARHPAPLYNKLALIVLNKRRDFRQAEELLRSALALQPDNEVYKHNLMKVLTLAAASSAPKTLKGGLLDRLLGKK